MPSFVPNPRTRPLDARPGPTRLAATLVAALFAGVLAVGCGGAIDADLEEVRALHEVGDFNSSIETLRGILAREPDHAEDDALGPVDLGSLHACLGT